MWLPQTIASAAALLVLAAASPAQEPITKVTASRGRTNDHFGGATDLHGGTMIVGADRRAPQEGRASRRGPRQA